MTKKLLFSLLVIIIITLPLLTGVEGIETTPMAKLTATPTTSTSTPTTGANWWDRLGEPTYGGTLVQRTMDIESELFDPISIMGPKCTYSRYYLDSMFQPDWTVDPDTWDFKMGYTPAEYLTGALAESWEQTDPLTWTVTIRQGVHFENRPPVNGRELTAADVEYNYDRLLGTGNGFTEPNPYWSPLVPNLERVVAVDDYTVEYRFKQANAFNIDEMMESVAMYIVPREWVEQGDLANWENAIGSGPFIMQEYVRGSTISFTRNPDYWGVDERHPENQLPYVDETKDIQIADWATTLAAMRTGKIDMIVGGQVSMSLTLAESLANSNPEIIQGHVPNAGFAVLMRCDTPPFTDIRVRKAMQMAIDRPTIAQVHYKGLPDGKPCGLVNPAFKGFATPFDEWPAELQAEYTYDVEGAKALLAEAAADGVFEPNKMGGFDTNVMAMSHMDIELLEIMKAMWLDVGVDVEINARGGAVMMPLFLSGKYDQMSFWGQTGATFSPRTAMFYRQSENKMNFTQNNDAHYNDLMAQFNAATEMEEAKRISVEADMYLLEQHWSIQTFPIVTPFAYQPYLKGWSGEHVVGWTSFVPARVWIDQELKESMGY